MPTIKLTNDSNLILDAGCADGNATLNRYLTKDLTLHTPHAFDAACGVLVKDQEAKAFPITLSAGGEGTFAVEGTSLDVKAGGSAWIGLLRESDAADFYAALHLTPDASSPGLVSFGVKGTLSAGDTVTEGDFTFGITRGADYALVIYRAAAEGDRLLDAVKTTVPGLTVPHDIADLVSLPAGAICRLDANSALKFSASFTYSFLNDPLAAVAIGKLPAFDINASASATIEGHASHTSGHTLTIAKLAGGVLHLSVGLSRTDDLETSLTVSAGATAEIGGQDALAFLLDKIQPGAAKQADEIAADMADAAQFKEDIKSAIDTALSSALAVSLKGALETDTATKRMFVYEVKLEELDDASRAALGAALRGDFTGLTRSDGAGSGITRLESVLTETAKTKHTLAVHLLGIFNAASVNTFISKSKIDFTADTHEIVLSDESLQVVENNLDAEKLRKLMLKDITLTLPASAASDKGATPVTIAYLDREASISRDKLRQFVNVLRYVGSAKAAEAEAMLKSPGPCGLLLALALDAGQCGKLFNGQDGSLEWPAYVQAYCQAERTILAGDPTWAWRARVFNASQDAWNELHDAGSGANIEASLEGLGMTAEQASLAAPDVITAVWWADAMAAYAKALARGGSLEDVGKQVVKKSNLGFHEPWMVLAAWDLAGQPGITADFVSGVPQRAGAAVAK